MSFEYANGMGVSIPNLIHASGDVDDAKQEIAHWFKPSELFEYDTVHDKYTQAKPTKK
jgi:nucleoside-diphosphate kinase